MNGVVMPRNRNLPKYENRSDRDVGFCRYYTADGKRRKKYFPGAFRSAESKAAYGQFIKEISQSLTPGLVPTTETGSRYRVAELAALWLDHCSKLYDREAETKRCAKAIQPVIDFCHDRFCDDFGPKDLKRCRSQLIRIGNSRKTIKDKINRVVQMFRWGAEEELCSETIYMKLKAVEPLRKGQEGVSDGRGKVLPVSWACVEPVLSHVQPPVAAMIRVQWLTGMRSGNLVDLRPCDLDRSDDVWVYRPAQHKTAYMDQDLSIFIGPQAQEVLLPYLDRKETAYCFSPRESVQALNADRGAVKCADDYQFYGDKYDSHAYGVAVRRGIEQANRGQEDTIPAWSPHQLRHARATAIQKTHGIEAARVSLGHANIATTDIYVESELAVARKIALLDG